MFVDGSAKWLLTFLSAFWSFGQLIASLIVWAFITNYATDKGWRYSLYVIILLRTTLLIWHISIKSDILCRWSEQLISPLLLLKPKSSSGVAWHSQCSSAGILSSTFKSPPSTWLPLVKTKKLFKPYNISRGGTERLFPSRQRNFWQFQIAVLSKTRTHCRHLLEVLSPNSPCGWKLVRVLCHRVR